MSQLGEDIIAAWMQLIAAIGDRWVVSGLSFNEALVCNLLSRRREDGGCLTASELCAKTKILKSQMNAILRSLEEKEIITRTPSAFDRRVVEVRLREGGGPAYLASHTHTLRIVDQLIASMGEEKIRTLLPLLHEAADTLEALSAVSRHPLSDAAES